MIDLLSLTRSTSLPIIQQNEAAECDLACHRGVYGWSWARRAT